MTKTYEKRICELCGEEFIPNQHNAIFCSHPVCQSYCKRSKEDREKYRENFLEKRFDPHDTHAPHKNNLKIEVDNIQKYLYSVKNGINIIKRLDKIHETLIKHMNILKIDTYPEEVKNHCIYIMKESIRFLQDQLKKEKDRGVIVVKAE